MSNPYLGPEDQARQKIDKQLEAAGWVVQSRDEVNVAAADGVAVRDRRGMPDPDYLLFVDGHACGTYEAKKDGVTLTGVEGQSVRYEDAIPDGAPTWGLPLRFAYEGTSAELQFTDRLDPDPRSRLVYAIHRPETLLAWLREAERNPDAPTLRSRFRQLPDRHSSQLWPHQKEAIEAIEESLAEDRPRALLQMATGSGKTFTAANLAYRLIKYAGARRILFLVDRTNLAQQAQTEFEQFITPDEQRKMSELYAVQRLVGGRLREDAKVVISTIQGVYASLTGTDAPQDDEGEPVDGPPVDVTYSKALPPESFDVIIIDEAHRSIYGRWRPVLEYFDAHLLGLTATPTKLTFGFFQKNLVYEYDHEQAVADGNNVPFEVYKIRTKIGTEGSKVEAGAYAQFRDRTTRRKQLELLEDDFEYDPSDLDRQVVAVDQIRTVITHFKNHLFKPAEEGGIFPGRTVVPKTLIFAKDDSHAEDIVREVRQVFGKGNDFCEKITSKSTGGKPEDLLKRFRNDYNPRIAVTVDLIATGTDVKSIECVFFMRAVKSRSYFEQMKGRGTRVMTSAEFQAVTNDKHHPNKTHFVIVDAVGVTDVDQQDTVPLERRRSVTLKKLLEKVGFGYADADDLSSIADRLTRIEKNLTDTQRASIAEVAGRDLRDIVRELMTAADPDRRQEQAEALARDEFETDDPTDEQVASQLPAVLKAARKTLQDSPALRKLLVEVQHAQMQLIDEISDDEVTSFGYEVDTVDKAQKIVQTWREYMTTHRAEIDALQVLYDQRNSTVLNHLEKLVAEVAAPPYRLSPEALWEAYSRIESSRVKGSLRSQVADLLAILRFELGVDQELKPFAEVVEWRWQQWLSEQDASARFTPEQMEWLELMKDVVTESLVITTEDFDLGELAARGGLGHAHRDFDGQLEQVMGELNRELAP